MEFFIIAAYLVVGVFAGLRAARGSEETVGVFWLATLFWPLALPFAALWLVAEVTGWMLRRLGIHPVHGDTHGV